MNIRMSLKFIFFIKNAFILIIYINVCWIIATFSKKKCFKHERTKEMAFLLTSLNQHSDIIQKYVLCATTVYSQKAFDIIFYRKNLLKILLYSFLVHFMRCQINESVTDKIEINVNYELVSLY